MSIHLPTPDELEPRQEGSLDDVKRLIIDSVKSHGVGKFITIPRRLPGSDCADLQMWAIQSNWQMRANHGHEKIGEDVFERSFVMLIQKRV